VGKRRVVIAIRKARAAHAAAQRTFEKVTVVQVVVGSVEIHARTVGDEAIARRSAAMRARRRTRLIGRRARGRHVLKDILANRENRSLRSNEN
jgi:hypothetical protein